MRIRFHPHARLRLSERGTTESEVREAIEEGETFPAKFGRHGFRKNFVFGKAWIDKVYSTKQLEVYAVKEKNYWLVITIITKFF